MKAEDGLFPNPEKQKDLIMECFPLSIQRLLNWQTRVAGRETGLEGKFCGIMQVEGKGLWSDKRVDAERMKMMCE